MGAALPPAIAPPAHWAPATASPVALSEKPSDPLAREALARCGEGEAGLQAAADLALEHALRGEPLPGADALAFAQRASGEPHPWARAWAASAKVLSGEAALMRLDSWLAEDRAPGPRRCAVAAGAAGGSQALALVAVRALADLDPLPTRARTGQWLTLAARLRVSAEGASVLILGPGGTTRRVPAWLDGPVLRARFALDRPGGFVVQVLATTSAGPRPVAEARVFADVEPPPRDPSPPAPGEETAAGAADDQALAAMLAAARDSAGELPLVRDPRLDALARDHAQRMMAVRALAHDAGDGDPADRLRAAGLTAAAVGENVAHDATVAGAHRALWGSPSHRANMTRRDFDRVGLAVVRDGDGGVWVVETFAAAVR
jgi:uncharacterized protein YkwD